MKKCPKCGIEFPDTENYCMECGKKLIQVESPPMLSVEDLVNLLIRVGEMESSLEDVDERISALKDQPHLPDDIARVRDIGKIEKTLSKVQERVANAELMLKTFRSEFSGFLKNSAQISQKEMTNILSSIGELETKVDELQNAVEEVRHYELPEDIVKLPKVIKGINRAVADVMGIKSQLPGMKADVKKMLSEFKGSTVGAMEKKISMMNTVIKNIERRTDSKLATLEKELQALASAQERIELEKIAPGEGIKLPDLLAKQKEQIKQEILQSVLKELRKGLVG